MAERQFTGKRVLVSGSGVGIGRGLALGFAHAGADVAFHYSHDNQLDRVRASVDEARAAGVRADAFPADFRDVAQVRRLAEQAASFLAGPVDVLVNNAGITMNRPLEETTPEQFQTLFDVNVRGAYFLTQAVVPGMAARGGGGCVINLSSVHAFEGMTHHSVYAATKGAIVAMTRELAVELGPRGVRVNAIAPGAIVVEAYYEAMPDFDPAAAGPSIPAGFIGEPRDVAAVALFLASDAARFVTGQTLIVDGGTTAWMPFNDGFRKPLGGQFGRGYVPGL